MLQSYGAAHTDDILPQVEMRGYGMSIYASQLHVRSVILDGMRMKLFQAEFSPTLTNASDKGIVSWPGCTHPSRRFKSQMHVSYNHTPLPLYQHPIKFNTSDMIPAHRIRFLDRLELHLNWGSPPRDEEFQKILASATDEGQSH